VVKAHKYPDEQLERLRQKAGKAEGRSKGNSRIRDFVILRERRADRSRFTTPEGATEGTQDCRIVPPAAVHRPGERNPAILSSFVGFASSG
jgi:hypothetical protein